LAVAAAVIVKTYFYFTTATGSVPNPPQYLEEKRGRMAIRPRSHINRFLRRHITSAMPIYRY
jgi:hypothetical protein